MVVIVLFLTCHIISFSNTDLGGVFCNELGDLLHVAGSPEQTRLIPLPQNLASESCGTRRGYAMLSENGIPPFDCPIDGKEDVHGLYLGLSGETDPYLLRHYKYDDHGDFSMFKLVFRQTANDLYNDIASDPASLLSPSDPFGLDMSKNRDDNIYQHIPIPVHFVMVADELADDAKEETTVRPHMSPESVRIELDQLIKPEDGIRLAGLSVRSRTFTDFLLTLTVSLIMSSQLSRSHHDINLVLLRLPSFHPLLPWQGSLLTFWLPYMPHL